MCDLLDPGTNRVPIGPYAKFHFFMNKKLLLSVYSIFKFKNLLVAYMELIVTGFKLKPNSLIGLETKTTLGVQKYI